MGTGLDARTDTISIPSTNPSAVPSGHVNLPCPQLASQTAAPDIAVLTAALSRGEEPAFHLFYHRYVPRLLRYLLVLAAGREEVAREVLQQTLMRVARHVKMFDAEEKFWSWLTVVARTAFVDDRRKQNRYLAFLDRFLHRQSSIDAPSESDAERHLSILLEEEVERLPGEERALIERKYFSGASVQTIAEETHLTPKAVEARLVRTRRKLKAMVLARLHHET